MPQQSCGHTFCRLCVKTRSVAGGSDGEGQEEGACPTCGKPLPDPDSLVVNVQMQGMVSFYLSHRGAH